MIKLILKALDELIKWTSFGVRELQERRLKLRVDNLSAHKRIDIEFLIMLQIVNHPREVSLCPPHLGHLGQRVEEAAMNCDGLLFAPFLENSALE